MFYLYYALVTTDTIKLILNVIFVLRNEFKRGAHEYLYYFKMAAIFKMAATSNIILGIFRQIFFSEPIILCNSTFLGFLRSRKPNLTFSNSKWPPFLKWR